MRLRLLVRTTANQKFESLFFVSQTASHPASAEKYGDGAFDADPEALGLLERGSFFGGGAFCSLLTTALRNTRRGDTCVAAEFLIGGIVEAAVRGIGSRS